MMTENRYPSEDKSYGRRDSVGICVDGYSKIVLFHDEDTFNTILAVNPRFEALFGNEEHEKKMFPGIYIAGIMSSQR